jgi:branched-chain amino acid transport system ATP-binding protein
MGMVMDISDQVFVFNFGELIAAGKPEIIQSDPAVVEAYLGREKADISRHIKTQ